MTIIKQPEFSGEVKVINGDSHPIEFIGDLLFMLEKQVGRVNKLSDSCFEKDIEVGIALGYLLVIEKVISNFCVEDFNIVHKFIETFVNINIDDVEFFRRAVSCYVKARNCLLYTSPSPRD